MQKINSFLWFDKEAEEATNFYVSVFNSAFKTNSDGNNSKILNTSLYNEAVPELKGTIMIMTFQLLGNEFIALNGGPVKDFTFNPSLSFFVKCKSKDEMENLWKEFSKEGKILMNLDKYPFSEKYGWIQDKFGVSWQLNLSEDGNKINPFLMFVQEQNGKADEAIKYYASILKDSRIDKIERYPSGEKNAGKVIHASFFLHGQEFMAMDGGKEHDFNFTPAISYFINCENQEEVDDYWEKLSKNGEKGQCGWLKDKFGISWQIVPTELMKLMSDADNKKSESVMKVMMKMTKLNIAELKNAYEQSS